MIEIAKNMSNEPKSLQKFRSDKKSDGMFDTYSSEIGLSELRNNLLEDQGNICCYCMSSISIPASNKTERTKIEHYIPRDKTREVEVNYHNLYLSCDGKKQCKESNNKKENTHKNCACKYKKGKVSFRHCDTCKGNRKLKHIKLDGTTQSKIKYKSSGIIYSDDENIGYELNYILNLNNSQLVSNRKQAKQTLWQCFPEDKKWSSSFLKNKISQYKNMDKKAPYVGFLIYVLQLRLSRN